MFEVALTVLLVMAGAGALAAAGSRRAAWLTLGAAVVWPFLNGPMEGPVMLVVGHGHGLTLSDLLAPAGVLLSIGMLTGWCRRAVRGHSDGGAT